MIDLQTLFIPNVVVVVTLTVQPPYFINKKYCKVTLQWEGRHKRGGDGGDGCPSLLQMLIMKMINEGNSSLIAHSISVSSVELQ